MKSLVSYSLKFIVFLLYCLLYPAMAFTEISEFSLGFPIPYALSSTGESQFLLHFMLLSIVFAAMLTAFFAKRGNKLFYILLLIPLAAFDAFGIIIFFIPSMVIMLPFIALYEALSPNSLNEDSIHGIQWALAVFLRGSLNILLIYLISKLIIKVSNKRLNKSVQSGI